MSTTYDSEHRMSYTFGEHAKRVRKMLKGAQKAHRVLIAQLTCSNEQKMLIIFRQWYCQWWHIDMWARSTDKTPIGTPRYPQNEKSRDEFFFGDKSVVQKKFLLQGRTVNAMYVLKGLSKMVYEYGRIPSTQTNCLQLSAALYQCNLSEESTRRWVSGAAQCYNNTTVILVFWLGSNRFFLCSWESRLHSKNGVSPLKLFKQLLQLFRMSFQFGPSKWRISHRRVDQKICGCSCQEYFVF